MFYFHGPSWKLLTSRQLGQDHQRLREHVQPEATLKGTGRDAGLPLGSSRGWLEEVGCDEMGRNIVLARHIAPNQCPVQPLHPTVDTGSDSLRVAAWGPGSVPSAETARNLTNLRSSWFQGAYSGLRLCKLPAGY